MNMYMRHLGLKWILLMHAVKLQRYSSTLSQCFVTAVAKIWESLLGQYVATVAAHQPGEFPESSTLNPCDRLNE